MHTAVESKTSFGHLDDSCYICMCQQSNINYQCNETGQDIKT